MYRRVLMVATVPSMIGQFNMDNIRILRKMGCDVDIAADYTDTSVWPPARVSEFKQEMCEEGIKCMQLDFSRSVLNIARHIKSYKELVNLMLKRDYSLIHTHTPIASAIARLAARKKKNKVVYTAHGFHFFKGAPLKAWLLFYPIEKWLSRYTDVLITINKEDFRRAKKHFRAKQTIYIPGVGVDTNRFALCSIDRNAKRSELGIKEEDFALLSVGELSERKNQQIVIEAIRILRQNDKADGIVYLLVGTGELEEEYHQLIRRYNIEQHVRLLGFRTDTADLYKAVDCFVHPSIREGLGIAPLEAMASGLPVITSGVNGIRDYAEDGVTGFCVEPTDATAVARAIEEMRTDKEFRDSCALNNKIKAKEFDKSRTNEIMSQLYHAILDSVNTSVVE